jgi:cobalt-zinc-cadmium efflux system membrane fusion protein
MRKSMPLSRKATAVIAAVAGIVFATVLLKSGFGQPANPSPPPASVPAPVPASNAPPTVPLEPSQLDAIKIGAVGTYTFPIERTAVGSIDYDEDLSVQVFSVYQGKIINAYANLGDDVKKGQPLYTIESPDLMNAESALIAAVSANILFSNELVRATDLYGTNGVAKRELEQATSDANTAEGAYKAAHDAVRVFGKTEDEINQIETSRKIDPALVVPSPVSGRITARCAQPGLLVQPGNLPAPYTVSDLSTVWLLVNVTESDVPMFHVGQPVAAKVMAFPGRVFDGKILRLGTTVDPTVHRLTVICNIADPKGELHPGMIANFTIAVEDPIVSVAIPTTGVDRNSDGTYEVWVTTDRHIFTQRQVKIGLESDGQYQVLDGLKTGELVVTSGAVFLSNILYAPPSD